MVRTLLVTLVLVVSAVGTAATEPRHNIVVRWNDVTLDAVTQNPPEPTTTCWRLYVVSASMYEAWAAYDDVAVGPVFGSRLRRPPSQRTLENKRAAVSQAAYQALSKIFPEQEPDFRALLEQLGYRPTQSHGVGNPAGLGRRAAEGVLADRLGDGSNAANGFIQTISETYPELYEPLNSADPNAPNAPGGPEFHENHWQPLRVPNGNLLDEYGVPIYDNDDPDTYTDQTFLTPHWGAVRPFSMTHGSQFRPVPPPQYGSTALYTDALGNTMTNDEACWLQFGEVLELSGQLDDYGKIIAEFWADGPRTWTPPGHWNQLAYGVSIRDHHTLDDDIKMFFALNGGLLDASIGCWEAKRHYDFVRPISAIRHHYYGQTILAWGGPNHGTREVLGQDWQPYQAATFMTPAFAEYVSGHSTFSQVGREILAAYSGTDAMYDGVTRLHDDYDGDGVEDLFGQHVAMPGSMMFEEGPSEPVVLRWPTLTDASIEAGISRLYGGIHIQDGNLRGRELGEKIGQLAFETARSYWTGEAEGSGERANGSLWALDSAPPAVQLALTSANPSREGFRFQYSLPTSGLVRIDVYDLSGRHVCELISGVQEAGPLTAAWDGVGKDGGRAAAGLYFVRLEALGQHQLLKVALIH